MVLTRNTSARTRRAAKRLDERTPIRTIKGGLWHTGTRVHGKPHGHGELREARNGRLRYVGQFRNGMRHGRGTSYCSQGLKWYVGQWQNGERSGGKAYGINVKVWSDTTKK